MRNTENRTIREAMRLAAISQKELSGYIGVVPATLNRLLKYPLPVEDRYEIVNALNFLLKQREKDLRDAQALLNPDQ